jgi:hypothetical protein
LGVSPIAASAITGFALVVDASNLFSTSTQVNGQIFAADYSDPTPAMMTAAISDMEAAYTDVGSRNNVDSARIEIGAGLIGNMMLTSGVSTWTTNVIVAANITLSGGPCEVHVSLRYPFLRTPAPCMVSLL